VGVYADLTNKVADVLEAERQPGQALDYCKAVLFGDGDTTATLLRPFIWITLDDPALEERWAAAQNVREGELRVLIHCESLVLDEARPYGVTGDATKRGPLTMLADVANRIEANRTAILAASGKATDFNITGRLNRRTGERSMAAVLLITFKTRFIAGSR
jgi:hypothetical protein